MNNRSRFKPYTFRSKLLLVLLLCTLAASIISTASTYMVNIFTTSSELSAKEHEVAVNLLGLVQKTQLDTGEMLTMASTDSLVLEVLDQPEDHLSAQQLQLLQQGELITVTSGLTSMPATYVLVASDVVTIHPARDFSLFRSILPRIAFNVVLSLVLFILLSVLVSFSMSRPFSQLTAAIRQIKEGDFSVRLPDNKQGEVGELMRAFNSMTEGLSQTAYLQKDFISSISHEFRTPIASIKGFARLLQMPGVDEDARQEYVQLIAQESDRLSRLANTLLRLSALEQQTAPASLSTFRLDEQLRQVILQLEPAWSPQEINWQLEMAPVTIESDADLLTQVWINLIQNAVKFSEKGGTIEITVSAADQVQVCITDHGIGMSEETVARIFDRFYQGDSSRSKEGVGLGLCLVKRIMDMLNGSIRVRSALGEGSSFRITLPIKRKEASHA